MISKKNLDIKRNMSYVNFYSKKKNKLLLIITPNLPQISRELTSNTQIKVLIKRSIKLRLKDLFIFLLNNILFFPNIIKKDFAIGIKLLCELEIIYTKKNHYILHNQLVDTAVALNNQKIITNFFYLAKKYNFKPGLMTNNIGPFLLLLSRTKNMPNNLVVYTSISKDNYLMNPTYEDVYDFLMTSKINFIAITNN